MVMLRKMYPCYGDGAHLKKNRKESSRSCARRTSSVVARLHSPLSAPPRRDRLPLVCEDEKCIARAFEWNINKIKWKINSIKWKINNIIWKMKNIYYANSLSRFIRTHAGTNLKRETTRQFQCNSLNGTISTEQFQRNNFDPS